MFDVTFGNISPPAFERLRQQLTGPLGARMADSNTFHCQGVHCRYHYDPAARSLALSLLVTPPVVTQGYVIGWLHDELRKHSPKTETNPPGGK